MNRRSYLALAGGTVATGLAGCLEAAPFGGGSAARTDDDPRYPDDRNVPADAETHDLYVENYDDVVHDVTLAVVRTTDDALIWRADYEAPDRRGFSVPELLVEDRTYETTLTVADGPEASDTRTIEACPNPNGGSKNVGIWIEDGTITVRQDNCDVIRVGANLNYGDHESFVVDDSA